MQAELRELAVTLEVCIWPTANIPPVVCMNHRMTVHDPAKLRQELQTPTGISQERIGLCSPHSNTRLNPRMVTQVFMLPRQL